MGGETTLPYVHPATGGELHIRDPKTAKSEIDRVIQAALDQKRPVYHIAAKRHGVPILSLDGLSQNAPFMEYRVLFGSVLTLGRH